MTKWTIWYGDACKECQGQLQKDFFQIPEEPLVTLECGGPGDIHGCPQKRILNLFVLAGLGIPDWAVR